MFDRLAKWLFFRKEFSTYVEEPEKQTKENTVENLSFKKRVMDKIDSLAVKKEKIYKYSTHYTIGSISISTTSSALPLMLSVNTLTVNGRYWFDTQSVFDKIKALYELQELTEKETLFDKALRLEE